MDIEISRWGELAGKNSQYVYNRIICGLMWCAFYHRPDDSLTPSIGSPAGSLFGLFEAPELAAMPIWLPSTSLRQVLQFLAVKRSG
jgi:hypothetical protein